MKVYRRACSRIKINNIVYYVSSIMSEKIFNLHYNNFCIITCATIDDNSYGIFDKINKKIVLECKYKLEEVIEVFKTKIIRQEKLRLIKELLK